MALLMSIVLPPGLSIATTRDKDDKINQDYELPCITLMDNDLALSQRVATIASPRDTSRFLAIEGIAEIDEERGEMNKAIEHLNRLVQQSPNNHALCTIVRCKLRDIYNELNMTGKALAELDRIVAAHGQ